MNRPQQENAGAVGAESAGQRQTVSPQHADVIARLLAANQVSCDEAELKRYSSDWWPISVKQMLNGRAPYPGLVVWPESTHDVRQVLRWAHQHNIPLTPVGGQSSVVGGAVPPAGGVALALTRMASPLALDEVSLLVTTQAGIRGHELESYLNARGYTLGHYPQSLELSTAGGWVATRASGTFSAKYGSIEDLVQGMRVVLADGSLVSIAPVPRKSVGPDLKQLFLGSEGTLGVVTEVDLRIQRIPECRRFRGVAFVRLSDALRAVREIVQADLAPALVRLYDPAEAARVAPPDMHLADQSLVLLAWDGPGEVIQVQEKLALEICISSGGRDLGCEPAEHWFRNRLDVSLFRNATRQPGKIIDTIEVSALWRNAEITYAALTKALSAHSDEVWAHFSHVYPTGTSLYVIFTLSGSDDETVTIRYHQAWEAAMEATLGVGASISHHHGVGLLRTEWMEREHGDALPLLRGIKRLLDPTGILNPGKLLPSSPVRS